MTNHLIFRGVYSKITLAVYGFFPSQMEMEASQASTRRFERDFSSLLKSYMPHQPSFAGGSLVDKKLFSTKLYHHIVAKGNILLNFEQLVRPLSETLDNQVYSDEEYTGKIELIVAKTLEAYQAAGDERWKTPEGLTRVLEDIFSIWLLMKEFLKHKSGDLFCPDSLNSEQETYKALSLPLVSLCLGILDMQKDLIFEFSLGLKLLSFLLNSKDHALEFVDGDGIEKLLRPLIGVEIASDKQPLPLPLQVQVFDAIEKIITYPDALRKIASKKCHFPPFKLQIGSEYFKRREKKPNPVLETIKPEEESLKKEETHPTPEEPKLLEKASISKDEGGKHSGEHKLRKHHSSRRSRSRSKSKGKKKKERSKKKEKHHRHRSSTQEGKESKSHKHKSHRIKSSSRSKHASESLSKAHSSHRSRPSKSRRSRSKHRKHKSSRGDSQRPSDKHPNKKEKKHSRHKKRVSTSSEESSREESGRSSQGSDAEGNSRHGSSVSPSKSEESSKSKHNSKSPSSEKSKQSPKDNQGIDSPVLSQIQSSLAATIEEGGPMAGVIEEKLVTDAQMVVKSEKDLKKDQQYIRIDTIPQLLLSCIDPKRNSSLIGERVIRILKMMILEERLQEIVGELSLFVAGVSELSAVKGERIRRMVVSFNEKLGVFMSIAQNGHSENLTRHFCNTLPHLRVLLHSKKSGMKIERKSNNKNGAKKEEDMEEEEDTKPKEANGEDEFESMKPVSEPVFPFFLASLCRESGLLETIASFMKKAVCFYKNDEVAETGLHLLWLLTKVIKEKGGLSFAVFKNELLGDLMESIGDFNNTGLTREYPEESFGDIFRNPSKRSILSDMSDKEWRSLSIVQRLCITSQGLSFFLKLSIFHVTSCNSIAEQMEKVALSNFALLPQLPDIQEGLKLLSKLFEVNTVIERSFISKQAFNKVCKEIPGVVSCFITFLTREDSLPNYSSESVVILRILRHAIMAADPDWVASIGSEVASQLASYFSKIASFKNTVQGDEGTFSSQEGVESKESEESLSALQREIDILNPITSTIQMFSVQNCEKLIHEMEKDWPYHDDIAKQKMQSAYGSSGLEGASGADGSASFIGKAKPVKIEEIMKTFEALESPSGLPKLGVLLKLFVYSVKHFPCQTNVTLVSHNSISVLVQILERCELVLNCWVARNDEIAIYLRKRLPLASIQATTASGLCVIYLIMKLLEKNLEALIKGGSKSFKMLELIEKVISSALIAKKVILHSNTGLFSPQAQWFSQAILRKAEGISCLLSQFSESIFDISLLLGKAAMLNPADLEIIFVLMASVLKNRNPLKNEDEEVRKIFEVEIAEKSNPEGGLRIFSKSGSNVFPSWAICTEKEPRKHHKKDFCLLGVLLDALAFGKTKETQRVKVDDVVLSIIHEGRTPVVEGVIKVLQSFFDSFVKEIKGLSTHPDIDEQEKEMSFAQISRLFELLSFLVSHSPTVHTVLNHSDYVKKILQVLELTKSTSNPNLLVRVFEASLKLTKKLCKLRLGIRFAIGQEETPNALAEDLPTESNLIRIFRVISGLLNSPENINPRVFIAAIKVFEVASRSKLGQSVILYQEWGGENSKLPITSFHKTLEMISVYIDRILAGEKELTMNGTREVIPSPKEIWLMIAYTMKFFINLMSSKANKNFIFSEKRREGLKYIISGQSGKSAKDILGSFKCKVNSSGAPTVIKSLTNLCKNSLDEFLAISSEFDVKCEVEQKEEELPHAEQVQKRIDMYYSKRKHTGKKRKEKKDMGIIGKCQRIVSNVFLEGQKEWKKRRNTDKEVVVSINQELLYVALDRPTEEVDTSLLPSLVNAYFQKRRISSIRSEPFSQHICTTTIFNANPNRGKTEVQPPSTYKYVQSSVLGLQSNIHLPNRSETTSPAASNTTFMASPNAIPPKFSSGNRMTGVNEFPRLGNRHPNSSECNEKEEGGIAPFTPVVETQPQGQVEPGKGPGFKTSHPSNQFQGQNFSHSYLEAIQSQRVTSNPQPAQMYLGNDQPKDQFQNPANSLNTGYMQTKKLPTPSPNFHGPNPAQNFEGFHIPPGNLHKPNMFSGPEPQIAKPVHQGYANPRSQPSNFVNPSNTMVSSNISIHEPRYGGQLTGTQGLNVMPHGQNPASLGLPGQVSRGNMMVPEQPTQGFNPMHGTPNMNMQNMMGVSQANMGMPGRGADHLHPQMAHHHHQQGEMNFGGPHQKRPTHLDQMNPGNFVGQMGQQTSMPQGMYRDKPPLFSEQPQPIHPYNPSVGQPSGFQGASGNISAMGRMPNTIPAPPPPNEFDIPDEKRSLFDQAKCLEQSRDPRVAQRLAKILAENPSFRPYFQK